MSQYVCRRAGAPQRFAFLFLILLLLSAGGRAASTGRPQPKDAAGASLTLNITGAGAFSVSAQDPAWTFSGNIGVAVSGLASSTGTDGIGPYRKISFTYSQSGVTRSGSIRAYTTRSIAIFSTTFLAPGKNTAIFPRVSSYPQGLFQFSFGSVYEHYYGAQQSPEGPWANFDAAGNTFIVSPASHFPIALNTHDADGSWMAGIHPGIATLPAGFTQDTMLAVGKGVNETFEIWGHALTDLQGKVRPRSEADVSLIALSYWTDSASKYYYSFDSKLGYEGTLKGVKDEFAQQGIPINSMQLDSWYYPKGNPPAWDNLGGTVDKGEYASTPDPNIIPHGLNGVRQMLGGIPLMTHARWVDPSSPIRQQYAMSGNVSIDPQYWKDLAAYFKSSGVMTYEQDWLASYAKPDLNVTDPEMYLDQMSGEMANAGITLQYCAPTAGQLMQGSKYSNLTTTRVSGDGFNRGRWDPFLYNSRMASAIGVFPFADNVYSTDVMSLLLATHSTGMVAVGDAIGEESAANIFQSIRSDGVIVKADAPIVPLNSTYLADARAATQNAGQPPMAAYTYSDHGALRTGYVFAYSRTTDGSNASIAFNASEVGIGGSVYIYDYFAQTGRVVDAGSQFTASVAPNGTYYIVAPIGVSGIALLGDTGKFASVGSQRIPDVEDGRMLLTTVQFATGEASTTIQGYAPTLPLVTPQKGLSSLMSYDATTHLFTVQVAPGSGDDHTGSFYLSLR